MPIKQLDRESMTRAIEVLRVLAIFGKAGRYMSMEKGPMAVNMPSMRMR